MGRSHRGLWLFQACLIDSLKPLCSLTHLRLIFDYDIDIESRAADRPVSEPESVRPQGPGAPFEEDEREQNAKRQRKDKEDADFDAKSTSGVTAFLRSEVGSQIAGPSGVRRYDEEDEESEEEESEE